MVGILVRGCRCATSWCDLDFAFDLAVVTLDLYKLVRAISQKPPYDVGSWYLAGTLVRVCRCATS